MNFHFALPWSRPKPSVHVVPRFHAATRAEQREARAKADSVRDELQKLRDSITDDAALAAAIARASMRNDKQREGRA